MSRRNSSLVISTLGNLASDEEVAPPYTTTTVIEIEDNDEIYTDDHASGSTERIFQRVFGVHPLDDLTVEETNPNPSYSCSRLNSWFRSCWNQLTGCFTAKLEALHEKLETRCEKSYLEAYFLYANICGVSPFRFGKASKPIVWLNKVPYYIVNTLAAFDTARITKKFILSMVGAHKEGSSEIRIYLLNSLTGATILLRVGFFLSLKFHPEKYLKAIQAVNVSSYNNHLYTVKSVIVSSLICCTSICVVLIKTHFELLYFGLEYYLNINARDALSLFCFTRSNLEDEDMSGYSALTTVFGLLGWATTLAGAFYGQIATDAVLFSAITLGKAASAFKFKERANVGDPENENVIEVGSEINTEYEDLKKISKHINSAFNVVFRFFLLMNIFMFAVFIDVYFNPEVWKVMKVVKSVNVVIVCVTFYYANLAAKTGDRFREWMKQEQNRKILKLSKLDIVMESLSSSIGYGRGALFIYDSTLIGFAGVVAAYFLGIVETRPKKDGEMEEPCTCLNSSILR